MLLFHAFSFKSISTETVNSSRGGNTLIAPHPTTCGWVLNTLILWTKNKEQQVTSSCLINSGLKCYLSERQLNSLENESILESVCQWHGRCLWKYYLCTLQIVQRKGQLQWESWDDALKPFQVPKNAFQTLKFHGHLCLTKNSLGHLLNSFLLGTYRIPHVVHEIFSKEW